MKITRIHTHLVEIPYKTTYQTATNTTKYGRHIVTKIETNEGVFGWGETGIISRLYPLYGDSPDGMFAVITTHLAPAIIGADPTEIGVVMNTMEKTLRGNYFAKCALDHALYDITGKVLNVSVAKLLGGAQMQKFSVSRSLPLGTPKEIADSASQLLQQGYTRLTLKGGLDYVNDISCFKAAREVVGDGFPLEIDLNGGYDKHIAIKTILKMEEFAAIPASDFSRVNKMFLS